MRKTMILAAMAGLAFASVADAKSCKDAKGHHVKCPVATSLAADKTHALAVDNKGGTLMATSGGSPHCVKGKPCGHSCIAMDKVCHK